MKAFILTLYIITVLIIPQLYTFMVRKVEHSNDKYIVGFIFGLLTMLLLVSFTYGLLVWDILTINL